MADFLIMDELDRAITHALQIDGRVPFSHVASVLGVSDQTVARRYRRLRTAGSLRVVGLPQARRLGWVEWVVRIEVTPDAAVTIAEALARRSDTSWVSLTSGGTQIVCVTQARSSRERDALLLGQLPRTPRIIGVTAHCLLRVFVGGPIGWHGKADFLDREQVEALSPPASVGGFPGAGCAARRRRATARVSGSGRSRRISRPGQGDRVVGYDRQTQARAATQ